MDNRRVRYGIMLLDEQFVELLSIKRSRNGFIVFVPKSGKHFTILVEEDELSSHKTYEKEKISEHIGRLNKDIDLDDEDTIERLYHPRILESDEYSKTVIFLHSEFIQFITGDTYVMKKKETDKEIVHYFDIEEIFNTGVALFERFKENPSEFAWVGAAEDLLENESLFGFTEDQKVIIEVDSELVELDTTPMSVFEEGNPLMEFLQPLGFPELLLDSRRILSTLSDN